MLARGTPKTPFSLKNFIAGMTCPTPGSPHIPQRWRPKPQRTRTDCTAQAAGQAVPDARQTTHKARHTIPDAGNDVPVCTRYQTGHTGAIGTAAGRWRAGNASIMRIVIALSQAWYIDSNMNKYHKGILLFLVIANCYLSIDI